MSKIKQFLFGIVSFLILIPIKGLANDMAIQDLYGPAPAQIMYGPAPTWDAVNTTRPWWIYLLYIGLPLVISITLIVGVVTFIKKRRKKHV
jgi:hypothetical protein